MGGIVLGEGGIPLKIGGVADHVHLLVTLKPKHDLSTVLQKLKSKSSGWVHDHFPNVGMWWQDGYGAFTVSHSGLGEVNRYIDDQEAHHRAMTFQDEFRIFLDKHGVMSEERDLWSRILRPFGTDSISTPSGGCVRCAHFTPGYDPSPLRG